MSDPRSLLERERRRFIQADGAFERLQRRRDSKRRNQRIRAGVLGLAIAIAVGWLAVNAIRSTPQVPTAPSEPTTSPTSIATTEKGEALAESYQFLDGDVTFAAAPPWDYSVLGWDFTSTMDTLVLDRNSDERVILVADPLPVVTRCQEGPAPADALALARSIGSNPNFETTEPVAVTVGGIQGSRIDVVAAPRASDCEVEGTPWVMTAADLGDPERVPVEMPVGQRMRLHLLDLPGGSAQVLAIAISAPEPRFERVVEAAAPILDSIELHAP